MPAMLLRVVALVAGLSLVAGSGVWFAVTSDRWPGDNRDRVSGLVFSFNKVLGRWLLAHAEPSPCVPIDAVTEQPLQPPREPLTAAEVAEATAAFEKDPRSTNRDRLQVGVSKVRAGPLGRGVTVGVGGGSGSTSTGSGCSTRGARRG